MRKSLLMYILLSVFSFAVSQTACNALEKQKAPAPEELPGWILVWHDEFDGNAVDATKWRIEDAALVKNHEMQYYSPEQVSVHDGILTLKSEKKQRGGRPYMSGLVETKGIFSQEFGRFEIRAKEPRGQGIWPAIWMMPAAGGWPPEIDIMELLGHEPNTVYMTNHYGKWPNNRLEGTNYIGPDYTQDFHTFALEWDSSELRWFVDGVKRFSTKKNVPSGPFYIILNTAVGGDWPGYPDKTTRFPQTHDIDYVRVYKRDIAGTFLIETSAVNGSVKIAPEKDRFEKDSSATIAAVPDIGYQFKEWSGDITGNTNPVTIKIVKHVKIQADFVRDPNAPQLISKGKKAVASSLESQMLAESNATDGKNSTRWSSLFKDPQWIYIDLGKTCDITAVRLIWEAAFGKEYEIQVSNDASTWKTVYSTGSGDGDKDDITLTSVKARYVRMYGKQRGTSYGYSLFEFEIYGK